MRPHVVLVALLLAAPVLAHAEEVAPGQKRVGFALELNLGTSLFAFNTGGINGGVTSFNNVQGGFFAGAKLDRVVFGMGFGLTRFATGMSSTNGPSTSTAETAIMFLPGVRVAIVRSRDQRVELFGQFDLGFGTVLNDQASNTSTFRFSYDVGPGVRFWVHPQFAVGAVTGVQGQFDYVSTTNNNVTVKNSDGLTSIFAAIQLMGVF